MILSLPRKILKFALDFVYPKYCCSCSVLLKDDFVFCVSCFNSIKPVASLNLDITQTKKVTVFAAASYNDLFKKLITEKLYSKNTFFCKQLAYVIYKKKVIKNLDIDYLVPVPLHWTRYAKRGYNQSEVIANELSKLLNVPVANALKRNKKTKYQSQLDISLRDSNVKNAFIINNKYKQSEIFKNKKVLLVDDLFTTGATVRNCASVLYSLKPKCVDAVVACRVI